MGGVQELAGWGEQPAVLSMAFTSSNRRNNSSSLFLSALFLCLLSVSFALWRGDAFLLNFLSLGLSDAVEEGVYLYRSTLTRFINKGDIGKGGMFVALWCCWTQLGHQQWQHCWRLLLHPDCLAQEIRYKRSTKSCPALVSFKNKSLGKSPRGSQVYSLIFSPDGQAELCWRRVALGSLQGGQDFKKNYMESC